MSASPEPPLMLKLTLLAPDGTSKVYKMSLPVKALSPVTATPLVSSLPDGGGGGGGGVPPETVCSNKLGEPLGLLILPETALPSIAASTCEIVAPGLLSK